MVVMTMKKATNLFLIFHAGLIKNNAAEAFTMSPTSVSNCRHSTRTPHHDQFLAPSKSWTERRILDISNTGATSSCSSRSTMFSGLEQFSDMVTTSIQYVDLESTTDMLISTSQEQSNEARIFGDAAHLILDFLTVLSPDTMLLRLLILLGRIFSILSDYAPDHTMTFDEVIFQSTMFAININMFLKKLGTRFLSLNKQTSFQDMKIYKTVFYPAGFTWTQYRILLSLGVIEWIECKSGTIIRQDNCSLMIAYKGVVEQIDDDSPNRHYGRTFDGKYCYDIIGDFSRAPEFLDKKKRQDFFKDNDRRTDVSTDWCTLRAGQTGATMLQLDMKKLVERVDGDDDISENIKNLYFNAMQKALISYSTVTTTRNPALKGADTTDPYYPQHS